MEYFYIYILKCKDDSYYIGHTDNIEQRISQHTMGKINGYTSTRLPIKLVYSELFNSREEAIMAERKLKRWSRKKKEILINKGWHGFEQ
jgi:predicted GIY-YIG superfamily endonuclease